MTIVSLTYTKKPQFQTPESWFYRIRPYLGILETMARRDTIISIDRIAFSGDITVNGVRHYFPDYGGNRLAVVWRLNRYTASLRPDVVLVQGMLFPWQVIALRFQLGKKIPIIAQNHSERPDRGFRGWLQRLADPCIDAYLFTAKTMGVEWVDRRIIRHLSKVHEVMEGSSVFERMDRQDALARTGASGRPVFLCVGRLERVKDPLTVVRAFLRFSVEQPGARLYMLYHTYNLLADIKALIGYNDSIVLVGERQHEEMGGWYNAADYIISGSHHEGSGYAVCEAMSCGCIPVLTDILPFRKMTGNGSCGVLYETGNETALLTALRTITALDIAKEKEKVLWQFNTALSFDVIAAGIHDIAASLLP
jgi:glycosyltransferase involved in cell wall biosynthesis